MKRWLILCGFLGLLLLSATVGATLWARHLLGTPGAAVGTVGMEVPPGQGAGQILRRLEDAGLVQDARLARAYLVWILKDPPLQAGEYQFEMPLTTPQVLEQLIRGEVVTHSVTLIEGLTLEEAAERLAAAGFGELDAFLRAMRDPAAIADLDPLASNLEGYLYPDTYHFARGTGETEIVATLVRTFRRRWQQEIEPLLAASGRTARQVVTLASIVEKEARFEEERPVIAGVYHNRLTRGIALYADPTVIFALKLRGTWDGNLRRPDLALDSPYNTYVYPGLPPGPICSPRLASLRAAVAPADVPYLYFVSRNDGSHVFAETLREHNRNVQIWQRDYWRKKWAAERRGK